MSLLTSCNLANPQNAHWVANDGTDAAPVIAGNPVQLCSGGPIASAAGVADSIVGTGGTTATLSLGTDTSPAMLVLGPRVSTGPDLYGGALNCQLEMLSNSNIQVNQFAQIIVNPDGSAVGPGQIAVNANGKIEMAAGSVLDFNAAGAQSSTYTATTVVGACANAATTAVANPAGLPSGTYAVMMAAVDNDTQFSYQASAMAVWDATSGNWTAGGVGSGHNAGGFVQLAPIQSRATLAIENFLGGGVALANISVVFKLLAAGA